MKLSIIESDISRRRFLANTGKGFLGILVGSGISPDIAKSVADSVVSGGKFGVFRHIQDSIGAYYDAAQESANSAWNGLRAFKRISGLDPMLVFGPDQIGWKYD